MCFSVQWRDLLSQRASRDWRAICQKILYLKMPHTAWRQGDGPNQANASSSCRRPFSFQDCHLPATSLWARLSSAVLLCQSGMGTKGLTSVFCELEAACFPPDYPAGEKILRKAAMCSLTKAFCWSCYVCHLSETSLALGDVANKPFLRQRKKKISLWTMIPSLLKNCQQAFRNGSQSSTLSEVAMTEGGRRGS